MKKVFIIGSKGLLGSELTRIAKQKSDWEVVTSDKSDGGIDITSESSIQAYLDKYQPQVIVNCAAFTNVDACETEEGYKAALEVNAYATEGLGRACKEKGINLVHISTDHVFGDDNKAGYPENYAKFQPLNNYAKTKLLAEQKLIELAEGLQGSDFILQKPKFYLVRTSWLFGPGATNFISKILDLAKTKPFLEVVTDEISAPTLVKDLSERIIYLLEHDLPGGIYHINGLGACSRYEFAKEIFRLKGIKTEVRATTLDKFERKAQVPHYSYLLNTKLPVMRTWQEMAEEYLSNASNPSASSG